MYICLGMPGICEGARDLICATRQSGCKSAHVEIRDYCEPLLTLCGGLPMCQAVDTIEKNVETGRGESPL